LYDIVTDYDEIVSDNQIVYNINYNYVHFIIIILFSFLLFFFLFFSGCAPGYLQSVTDSSCYIPTVISTHSILSGILAVYYFESSITSTVTSSFTPTVIGTPSYSIGGPTGKGFSLSQGYISIPTVPILNDFTITLWSQGSETQLNSGWRWLVSYGNSQPAYVNNGLTIGTNGNNLRVRKKKKNERKNRL
jgi:hypothetical protein